MRTLRPANPAPQATAGRILLLFVVISAATRWLELLVPFFNVDEPTYAVASWVMLDGGELYVGFADNKPPLLFAYYAGAQLLLGRGMLAVHLVTVLALVPLTAWAASAFYGHDRRGVVAGLAYLVYAAAGLGKDFLAVNGEIVALLPATAALAMARDGARLARPGRALAVGALLGTASLVKQVGGVWLVAIGAALLIAAPVGRWARARAAAALVAGAALPWCGAIAWFAARGAGAEMIEWTLTYNATYLANPVTAAAATLHAASSWVPFAAITGVAWWAFGRSFREVMSRWQRTLLGLALAASVAATVPGYRFFGHYLLLVLPPLCLGAAPAVAALVARRGWRARVVIAWPLAALAVATASNLAVYRLGAGSRDETDRAFRDVAGAVASGPCGAGARLFVWGYAPQVYYYSELPPASRFVLPQVTISGYTPGNDAHAGGRALVRAEHWDLLMGDLERTPAAYVVDTVPADVRGWREFPLADYPRLAQLVATEYEPIGRVGGMDLYRHRRCAAR